MRTALVGFVFLALASAAFAGPPFYTSGEGRYRIKFPDTPKVTETTTSTALGDLTVVVTAYAKSDGSFYMISYTDFPEAATKPANHKTLLDGIRNGLKGDGKLVGEEKTRTFGADKLPLREFVVERDKKQRLKCRIIVRDTRVYQLAVVGSNNFISSKDATAFLDSFELK